MDEDTEAAELRRYEQERRERIRARNRTSWHVVLWIMAGALALLAYDSVDASLRARDGGSVAYPLTLAVLCAIALVALGWWGLRRRRRR